MVVTEEMVDTALRAWFGNDQPAFAWLEPHRRKHTRAALEAAFALSHPDPLTVPETSSTKDSQ